MTWVALVHLLCLVIVPTGLWVADGHTVRGWAWVLVFITWATSGVVLAASVLA